MSMTIKQKQNMIPRIQEHIEELELDLVLVKSEISKKALKKELEEKKSIINDYQKHINNFFDNRMK